MSNLIRIKGKKSEVDFIAQPDALVKLVYVGELTENLADLLLGAEQQPDAFSPVEIHVTGDDNYHKGVKLISASVTKRLKFVSYNESASKAGKRVTITQKDDQTQLVVTSYFDLFDDTVAVRSWSTVENVGDDAQGLEYLSSFALSGVVQAADYGGNFATHVEISEPSNEWQAELQWHTQRLKDYGMNFRADGTGREATTKRVSMTNTGSWSCSEWSPNGVLSNTTTGQAAMWQIEHNGSWHSEIDDAGDGRLLRVELFGPEEVDSHWWKNLQPGETFKSVPIGFVQMNGDFEDVVDEMTTYRRNIRRKNDDNQTLPVIFNDYMNGLFGDPTTEKEMPLVHAAAKAGAEYFVIDCGWYADGYWWDSVGEWQVSKKRFPNGVQEVTQEIRRLGMVPGLWLEIEVMGVNCPLASKLPDDWFFMRHGKRVIDVNRYHLDFRNPKVREYASSIVDRLVNEYGLGYIKMDYNIITGIGSDLDSDSVGDGLLQHNRAYLNWIDGLFEKYPDLVIENCGSGGMRHDYAMLSRHSIQSMTDQTKYVRNGQISAASATAVTPEQAAIWSYPLVKGDAEEAIYNMVNAMLVRIHQSGYLNQLTPERFKMVAEGIDVYKTYRDKIPTSLPVWPTGVPTMDDKSATFGLKTSDAIYLGVWNCQDMAQNITVDLSRYADAVSVEQLYPKQDDKVDVKVNQTHLNFSFPEGKMARLYKITL